MFQLTADEQRSLRSQFATLKGGRGKHRKYLPYAFTEHGAIMAATVLNSPRAVEMSVYVVRAFVQLRELSARTKNWRADSRSSQHGSIRSSPPTMRRSPPSSPRSASS